MFLIDLSHKFVPQHEFVELPALALPRFVPIVREAHRRHGRSIRCAWPHDFVLDRRLLLGLADFGLFDQSFNFCFIHEDLGLELFQIDLSCFSPLYFDY